MRTEQDIKTMTLDFLFKTVEGIPFDRLQELCNAEREGRLVVLPCKVGEQLYVLSEKQYHVGNDYENSCTECELNVPYSYIYAGRKYDCCKKGYDGDCPTVVKPITVEVFEIQQNNEVVPCYRVDFEGNSQITNYSTTADQAEKALEGQNG